MAQTKYQTKDSGKREEYKSGMRRDTQEEKPRFDLILPEGQKYTETLIYRWAMLLYRGGVKYGEMIEEWRSVPSLKDIEVSNLGRVRHSKKKNIYKTWVNKWGYSLVSFSGQKRKHYQVHRLVMEAFVGPSNLQVNHKDFNRTNNHILNLEYCTAKQNNQHSAKAGRRKGNITNATINFDIAEEIRRRVHLGEKQKSLAKEFNLSPQTICDIMKRRIWRNPIIVETNPSSRNWEKANSKEELDRFKASAFRHFMQWMSNEEDEDHAAAVLFNINAYETIKERIK